MSSQPPNQPQFPRPAEPSAQDSQRLADQLHALSQVVETITYRLLDLEERAAVQEQGLQQLIAEGVAGSPAESAAAREAQIRLDDTEERLLRLESVLAGASSATAGHLSLVASDAGPQPDTGAWTRGTQAAVDIDGPFLEEPEQPFLDELEPDREPAEEHSEPPPGYLTA